MGKKMMEKTAAPAAEERIEGEIRFSDGIPAEVKEIITRAGSRGELTQVMCQILDGRDKDKAIRRNVKGPIKVGDILMLLDTEIEAQRAGGGRKNTSSSGSSSGSSSSSGRSDSGSRGSSSSSGYGNSRSSGNSRNRGGR